jgi:signal transduction histidine kinase
VDHFENGRQRKDGTLIDVSVTISPMRDDGGAIIGASKIARDVTMQKQSASASSSPPRRGGGGEQRQGSLSSACLSHELRTPLTPVLAAVS